MPCMQEMEMERVEIFVDLNNVEESMSVYKKNGLYLDYSRLIQLLTDGTICVGASFYDSTPNKGQTQMTSLHRRLRRAGHNLVLKKPAAVEYNTVRTCVQKVVDTSLCVDVVSHAYEDLYDTAIIISGDRDMRPSAECAERLGKKAVFAAMYDAMCPDIRNRDGTLVLDEMFVLRSADCRRPDDTQSIASFYTGEVVRDEV